MTRFSKTKTLLIGILSAFSLNLSPSVAGASSLQLDPISMSFPSSHIGFVLSLYDCSANTCAALRGTDNAAASWSVKVLPAAINRDLQRVSWGTYGNNYATLTVNFANAHDGWIYGSVPAVATQRTSNPNWVSRLWSTHDGGATWQQIHLGPLGMTGGVVQMATHGAWTYLFGGSDTSGRTNVFATHSDSDRWTNKSHGLYGMPAGGSPLVGAFSFMGSAGWLVAGNDRGFTASARLSSDGDWTTWKGPAIPVPSFCPLDAVTERVILTVCQNAGWINPPASTVPHDWNNGATWLFVSYDAGATFKPLRQLSNSYTGSYATVPGLPATPSPGTVLLTRATSTGTEMMRSTNWGRSWHIVEPRSVTQVAFASRSTGFAIVQKRTNHFGWSLLRTIDAGEHWSVIST